MDTLLLRMRVFFETEERARYGFRRMLWPNGFRCRKCNHDEAAYLPSRQLYECKRCRTQHSLTAGTALHRTRTPLHIWAGLLFCHTHPTCFRIEDFARQANLSERQLNQIRRKLFSRDPLVEKLLRQFIDFLYRRPAIPLTPNSKEPKPVSEASVSNAVNA